MTHIFKYGLATKPKGEAIKSFVKGYFHNTEIYMQISMQLYAQWKFEKSFDFLLMRSKSICGRKEGHADHCGSVKSSSLKSYHPLYKVYC